LPNPNQLQLGVIGHFVKGKERSLPIFRDYQKYAPDRQQVPDINEYIFDYHNTQEDKLVKE
jgi:hypothetical protein